MKKGLLFCVVVLTMILGGGKAWAANFVWTGATNSNWNVPGNWSGNAGIGYPGYLVATSDNVTINTNATITLPSGASLTGSVASITVNSGQSLNLTLAMNLTVTGAININGTTTFTGSGTSYTLSAGSLTLANSQTLNINTPLTITGSGAITLNAGTLNTNANGIITDTGGAISISNSGAITTNAAISAGTFTANSNTITFNAAAAFSGLITLNETITFTGNSPGALSGGSMSIGSGKTITNTTIPITVTNTVTTNGSVTFAGTGTFTGGALTASSAGTFTFSKNVLINNAANVNSGSTLTGGSTFTCGALTSAGTLTLATPVVANGNLTASAITNSATCSLTLNGSGSNTITGGLTAYQTTTFTLTGSATNTTISGLTVNGIFTVNIPLSSVGAINAGTGASITGTASGASISGTSLSALGGITVNTVAAFTVSGTTTLSGGACSFGTSATTFQSGDFILSGQTLTLNRPLKSTGTITTSNTAVINGSNTATINTVDVSSTGSSTYSLQAAFTGTGTMTFTGNTNTFNNTAATSTANVILNGTTLNMATALTVTSTITSQNGTNNFTNTGATGTVSLNLNSTTLTAATVLTAAGTISGLGGTNIFTNTSNTTAAAFNVAAGTFTLGSTSFAMNTTISGATTIASGTTFYFYSPTSSTATLTTGSLTCAVTMNIYGTCSITSAGTSNTIVGGIGFNNTSYGLTFLGTGSTTISGTTSFPQGNEFLTVGSASSTSTTVIFSAGASLPIGNTAVIITNYGNLKFMGTSGSPISITNSQGNGRLVNYGTLTANYTSYTVTNTPNYVINNTGATFNSDHFTLYFSSNSQDSYLQNDGTFTASAFAFTSDRGNTRITNSGTFTADGGSTINFTGANNNSGSYITNTGVFNAGSAPGVSPSTACNITITSNTFNINNTGATGAIAYFNLGSTSIINLNTTGNATVNNASTFSVFSLLSDQYGSASIGQITNSGTFAGIYNVQRFVRGGTTASYRGYRLLSSPVNSTAASTNGSGDNYINVGTINGNYAVDRTATKYYGMFTAGSGGVGGGFTVANTSATIFFYNEAAVTNNASFLVGKYVGVTAITAATPSVTMVGGATKKIPVGNGYLVYYVGSSNPTVRTTGSSATAPDGATITQVGYLNQGNTSTASTDIVVKNWLTSSQTLSLSGTAGGVNFYGYNMVGNPYASTIDLRQVYTDNSSQGFTTFYMLNNVNPQTYVSYGWNTATSTYTSSASTGNEPRYIASGQGFIVAAKVASKTLTFKEGQKVTTAVSNSSTPPSYLVAPDRQVLMATNNNNAADIASPSLMALQQPAANTASALHLKLEKDADTFDEIGVYFSANSTDKYDDNDAYDLDGVSPKVYLSSYSSDNIRTCVNTLADYSKGKRVKLYIKGTADGTYKISMPDISSIDLGLYDVLIRDNYKKDSLDIRNGGVYSFSISNADTATFGGSRLELIIRRRPLPPYRLVAFTGKKVADGVQINWQTINEGNYTGFVVERQDGTKFNAVYTLQSDGTANYTFTDRNPLKGFNTYRLQQNDIDNVISYSPDVTISIPKPGNNNNDGLFTVYPNPTTQGLTVSIASNAVTLTPGSTSYKLSIYNSAGLVMIQKSTTSSSWTEDVTKLKAGSYVVQLADSNGKLIGTTKFIKVQ